MAYFNEFPTINYVHKDGSLAQVKDILRRVIFTDESFFNESNYSYYTIKDGETPDAMAQKFFDDPELHWILVLYNQAFDPNYSFPLSINSLQEYIDKKYSGQALFLKPNGGDDVPFFSTTSLDLGDSITTNRHDPVTYPNNKSGTTVERFNSETLIGRVARENYSLSKIELVDQLGFFEAGQTVARRKWFLDPWRADVVRAVDGREAVHHFEQYTGTTSGVVLDPLATPPTSEGVQTKIHDNGTTFEDTILYSYIYNGDETYSVSNARHEFNLNNDKSQIKIPNKNIVQSITRSFRQLIKA
ncbi:baseplate wedge protein 53 [Hyphomonas sp.]|uniref:baseplate wedge protein 53 n=1 Tax=Hyphomonas sp. TaxID=87 RepID=UPI000C8CD85A|nr:baseplate wedge protein 53 [Hyphomonas sp.]MAL44293.1 hypothetical protein [Hyphomonas sp.]|tara:strand:- start:529 stop:1431 length:903 start_codon:yes stop_codon:yes gene_type:complete